MTSAPVRVTVQATDPLSLAGLISHLSSSPEIELLLGQGDCTADVEVVAVDRLTAAGTAALRRAAERPDRPVVLIVNQITESDLLTAVQYRVAAVIPRRAVTAEHLVGSVITAATGGGVMPPKLLGALLDHVNRLQRQAGTAREARSDTLTPREAEVLRLVADGWDTAEIAEKLRYSERTIKSVIQGMTRRLKLRNRSHAVAHALRTGQI